MKTVLQIRFENERKRKQDHQNDLIFKSIVFVIVCLLISCIIIENLPEWIRTIS